MQTHWFAAMAVLAAGATLSPLPASSEQALLPDPFLLADGSRVRTHADWPGRRMEMIAELEAIQYGKAPPLPSIVAVEEFAREHRQLEGSGLQAELVTAVLAFDGIRVRVGYWRPVGIDEPVPVLLACEPVWWDAPFLTSGIAERVVSHGFAFAGFWIDDLGSFEDPDHRPAQDAHPDFDWGSVAMGAWGFRVTMNWLETIPELDAQRVCIWGHSRRGKACVWAGALDTRFAAVIAHMSGMAGTAAYRVRGEGAQRLEQLLERYWLHPRMYEYAGRKGDLPFDQHWLHALIAPRPMLVHAGRADAWGNPRGEEAAWQAGQAVYAWLDAPDNLSLYVGNYGHHDPGQPEGADSWRAAVAFMEWHFRGTAPPAAFMTRPSSGAAAAFTWTAPAEELLTEERATGEHSPG